MVEVGKLEGVGYSLLYDISGHCAAAALGPYGLGGKAAILQDLKLWLYNLHLFYYPLPVEERAELFRIKVNEYAVVCLHRFYKQICEEWSPELIYFEAAGGLHREASLHSVGLYAVKRS